MESKDADRSQVTRRDHVDAVVAAIDSVEPADGKVEAQARAAVDELDRPGSGRTYTQSHG